MRRFEFSAGGSDKFWEITLEGNCFSVRYGRMGTDGQRQTKTFDTEQKAQKEHDKLIAEKIQKGYVEASAAPGAAAVRTARTGENLKSHLAAAGIDVSSFQRLVVEEDEYEEGSKRDFGNSFYSIEVPTTDIVSVWEKARALVDGTGFYPVISENPDELLDNLQYNEDLNPADTIKNALAVNVEKFFEDRKEDLYDDPRIVGTWTGAESGEADDFYVVRQVGADATLPIIFCPTKADWQVCAVIDWGNFNDCVAAEYHGAVHKSWGTEYGAELVCITHDILEFKVSRPPTTIESAMQLAHRQFVYCPDLVHQGVQTVSNLGKILINSNRWYFWWD
jgi:predicted DNA-binding WGR domain protein